MAAEWFDAYVRLIRASTPAPSSRDGRVRTFTPMDQGTVDQLNRLVAEPLLSESCGIVPLVDNPNLQIGTPISVRFGASPSNRVFETYDDVFLLPNLRAGQAFFVLEDDVLSEDAALSDEVKAYGEVSQLVERVRRLSASGDLEVGALGFVARGEFIKVSGAVDHRQVGTDERAAIAKLINYIDQHNDNVHFPDIFAKSLVQHVRSVREKDRIQHLVLHAGELLETLVLEYKVVMSAFSLNSVEQELQEARTNFISRVNKALSDIQAQLLGIPVSAIVVATQIKPFEAPSFQFAVNIGVLAGALIFSVFFCLLLWNQRHTLKAISLELQLKRDTFRAALGDKSALAEEVFRAVSERLTHQYRTFGVVAAAVVLGALAAIFMFVRATYFSGEIAGREEQPPAISEHAVDLKPDVSDPG